MVAHERHEHLEHVVEVLVLRDDGQVVEEGLQLVVLDAVTDHHQLLHEEQQDGGDACPRETLSPGTSTA